MTTIATDGRSMAGDGLVTAGNTILEWTNEKVECLPDGRIVGCCGDSDWCAAFVAWLKGGDNAEKPKLNEHFSALVLRPDGVIEWYGEQCVPVEFPAPQSIGSGSDFALAAMDCGLSPLEAVAAAAKRDTGTGGEITCLELETSILRSAA